MEVENGSLQPGQAAEVTLNPADRSLDCELEGPCASTISQEGFGYLWSGVRATHGITTGRFWFSVQIMDPLETTLTNIGDSADMYSDEDATANTIHCCRVGVSRLSTDVSTLGSMNSWGYGSTGKKSTGKMFSKYPANHPDSGGRRFGPGDEVTCFVELSPSNSSTGQQSSSYSAAASGYTYGTAGISFAVNGECLGLAFPLYQPADVDKALFPHVLVKNLRVLVRFRGERPLYWPKDKPWDGIWCGCLPWQACASQSPAPVVGPSLKRCDDCHVIMMVGLPCSGKSQQIAKLLDHRQQHGSRTVLYQQDPTAAASAATDQQQQQQQERPRYILLSTEAIINQMKVPGVPRRGGAAAARTCELLADAEAVFERLLALAAQHPANYIIDGCNVLAERRQWILEGFRSAGFKLIAGVVVEQDAIINQRMRRRDQRLRPAFEDLLEMKANFTLPEVDLEEFNEVQYLGTITDPQQAAQIVAAQRAAAQQDLQRLQQGAMYGGMGYNHQYEMMMQGYSSGMLSPGLSGASSLNPSFSAMSGRRSSNSSSGRTDSAALGFGPACVGYSPYNPVEQLYRPPQPGQLSPAAYQQGYGQPGPGIGFPPPAAAAAAGYQMPGQYPGVMPMQQQAGIYNPSLYAAGMAATVPPATPYSPHAQQYTVEIGRRRSSSGSSVLESGGSTNSIYLRQPSWFGPQGSQGLAATAQSPRALGVPGFSSPAHQGVGMGAVPAQHQQGLAVVTEGSGFSNMGLNPMTNTPGTPGQLTPRATTPNGSAIPPHEGYGLEQQQRQQHYHQQHQQQQRQSPWQRSGASRPWDASSAAAAQQQSAAAAADGPEAWPDLSTAGRRGHSRSNSGSKPAAEVQQQQQTQQQQQQSQRQTVVQPQPSVDKLSSPFASVDLQQHKQQQLPQQHQQQQQPQVHQVPAAAVMKGEPSVNPFLEAARQQPAWPSRAISIANGSGSSKHAGAVAVDAPSSNGLPSSPPQQLSQQQRQLQMLLRKLSGNLCSSFRSTDSTLSSDEPAAAAAGASAAVELSPELQQHMEQLQLACYTDESVVAALVGEGPSRKKAKKLGSGSFGSVFGCLLSDLQCCSPADATSPRPTPVPSGDGSAAAAAAAAAAPSAAHSNGCSPAAANGHSNGTAAAAGGDGDGQIVAVKVLNPKHCSPTDFVRELEVLARCRHQTVVSLQGYCLLRRALVFEYCSCGSLDDWLKGSLSITHGKHLGWRQRISIAHQVATALHFLHSQKPEPVVHRDVKPNNILLSQDLSARLADVGLSKFLPFDATSVYSSRLGCIHFMPNEYVLHGVVSPGADVFSFGLVLVQMVTGDLRQWPKRVLSQLAEVFSGYEAVLEAAAAAADSSTTPAAAAASGKLSPGAAAYAAPGRSTVAGAYAAAKGAAAAANAFATGVSPASSIASTSTGTSRSPWWFGVMANCKASSSSSTPAASSCTTSRSSSTALADVLSPRGTPPATTAAAAAAGAAGSRKSSWATVAAAPRSAATRPAPQATTTTRTAPTSTAAAAAPPVAAVVAPAAVPDGLRKMLDSCAGTWPPGVAMGLALIALACCEEQRRKRPRMEEVVNALQALLQQEQQQQ